MVETCLNFFHKMPQFTFEWKEVAEKVSEINEVIVTGTFDQWTQSIVLDVCWID
jgi:predicted ester cyclase